MASNFENIKVWQKSRLLVTETYKEFKTCKGYAFKDQIQRAAISVMNNIAEWNERKGRKEFGNFLSIAKGSCGEVKSMLYVAVDLGYISKEKAAELSNLCSEISKMLFSFMSKLTLNLE